MRRFYLLPTLLTVGFAIAIGGQTISAQASSLSAANGKVKIFTPTISAAPSVNESDVGVVEKTKVIIIRERYYHPFYTRKERLARAFGHRYPGFVKQYSGPKYPF